MDPGWQPQKRAMYALCFCGYPHLIYVVTGHTTGGGSSMYSTLLCHSRCIFERGAHGQVGDVTMRSKMGEQRLELWTSRM